VSPYLYEAAVVLRDGDEVLDATTIPVGIRSIRVDPSVGLLVNEQVVLLRGACVHADNGPLGAAAIVRAEERKVERLKEAGFNAVRAAHHPMSSAFLDACDRLGVYVVDEAFDVWTRSKSDFDDAQSFPLWWERDLAAMVAKDVNHPSVIMYSIGNEILELGTPQGAVWSRRLAEEVRRLDPSRPVTNGINGIIANLDLIGDAMAELEAADPNTMMANMGEQMAMMNASQPVTASIEEPASVLDVVGFNYADSRYRQDGRDYPHRVIVGSETFPSHIASMWMLVKELPHVIGDFTWTGWDYLGEAGIGRVDYSDAEGYEATGTAGPYPYLTAECGDLDITGHRRTISFYREIVFGLRTDPAIAVHRPRHHGRPTATTPWSWDDTVSSWSWGAERGAPVTVDVYADADEVELVLDGESLGAAPVGVDLAFRARFEIEYRPGELVAYARRGDAMVGRTALRTAGAAELTVRPEQSVAEVGVLVFVPIALEDERGTIACDRDLPVAVEVSGPGALVALATGRARTEEPFHAAEVTTYDGRALAVVRMLGAGDVAVSASAKGYRTGTAHISVTA
jgi:beta-galactosidase